MRQKYSATESILQSKADNCLLKQLIKIQCDSRVRCNNDAYSAIAADFIGPIYIPYVLFVLNVAQRRGIFRLYFLSRDGYILYEIAKLFQPQYSQIEIRYLHVSRKAIKPPFNYVQNGDIASKNEYFLLSEYFAQEGLFEKKKTGIVDIGWKGTTRMMINSILSSCGVGPADFFYLSTQNGVLSSDFGHYHSFFNRSDFSSELTFIFENYFSAAPEKSTIGYVKNKEGVISPLFEESQVVYDKIVFANKQTVSCMVNSILDIWESVRNNTDVISNWARETLEIVTSLEPKIDLTPLLDIQKVDGLIFVKKMTTREILLYTFCGKRNSVYAQASLKLSCNDRFYHCLFSIRKLLIRVKKVYLKYKR